MSIAWIGVDFDGTLASDENGWEGPLHAGPPIAPMVAFVQNLIKQGHTVKIMTARVGPHPDQTDEELEAIHQFLGDWSEEHIGTRLEATCQKDYMMIALFDDKAFHVTPNTGIVHLPEEEEESDV